MSDFTPTRILDTPVVLGSSAGTSEVVKIDFSPMTAGKVAQLELDGQKTAALKPKAEVTAAEVKSALEKLSNVGPGNDWQIISATGPLGGPVVLTFDPSEGDVPTIIATANEGSIPTVTTTTVGEKPAEAVTRGKGNADATTRTSPLAGVTPAADRSSNHAKYGDA